MSVNNTKEKELNQLIMRWLDDGVDECRAKGGDHVDYLAAILTSMSKGTVAIALSGNLSEKDFLSAMRATYRALRDAGRGTSVAH